jgi:arginyl-tRNA synthetase
LKDDIKALVADAVARVLPGLGLAVPASSEVQVDRTRDPRNGDFASNIAMVLAKTAAMNPRELATRIAEALPESEWVARAAVAGPGFINLYLKPEALRHTIARALTEGPAFGRSRLGQGTRVQVEFVSANPTGPLHIGHGRGAAYGAVIADLLEAVGFEVAREYYVNDGGRQMDILALSVFLRYLEHCGEPLNFPANAYRGEYVKAIAAGLYAEIGDRWRVPAARVLESIAAGEDNVYLDGAIRRIRELLGETDYRHLHRLGLDEVLGGIRQDLEDFGVRYECWFPESALSLDGSVTRAIERLEALGRTYVRDGALWFNSAAFGDEKDRVLVRENGQTTYFASDVAYHLDKLERGFHLLIDLWGADHHGYLPRVRAALAAVGEDPERLEVRLVQFATLFRGKERMPMSTRSGEFVTLRELVDEIGRDAARFFYVTRRSEQHLEFDLELAKSKSQDNPVYYIQYAHARIASVFRQLRDRGLTWDSETDGLAALTEAEEIALMNRISRYPEMVESAALTREPHQIAHYLREISNDFHVYYNSHSFLVDEPSLRNARLSLIAATRQVLRNGLALLGVSAPEAM